MGWDGMHRGDTGFIVSEPEPLLSPSSRSQIALAVEELAEKISSY